MRRDARDADGRRTSSAARGIADERVLAAMAAVPRERFVDGATSDRAYADEALPIEAGQTISQPYMVARMTELLAPRPGDRILEIGTGSGYQAAILALLGAAVVSIERHAGAGRPRRANGSPRLGLGGAVDVRVGDGSLGDPAGAPWDGIIVTAAAPVDPGVAPRAAGRRRPARHPGRRPRDRQDLRSSIRHGNDWTETTARPVRVRAARRGGRVPRLSAAAEGGGTGPLGILGRP